MKLNGSKADTILDWYNRMTEFKVDKEKLVIKQNKAYLDSSVCCDMVRSGTWLNSKK